LIGNKPYSFFLPPLFRLRFRLRFRFRFRLRFRFRPPSLTGRAGTGLCYLNTGINYQNDTIIYIIIPLCLFSDAKLLQKESFYNTFMSFYFH